VISKRGNAAGGGWSVGGIPAAAPVRTRRYGRACGGGRRVYIVSSYRRQFVSVLGRRDFINIINDLIATPFCCLSAITVSDNNNNIIMLSRTKI